MDDDKSGGLLQTPVPVWVGNCICRDTKRPHQPKQCIDADAPLLVLNRLYVAGCFPHPFRKFLLRYISGKMCLLEYSSHVG